MKVFVTKYALTKGILEIEGRVSESFPTMFMGSRTQTFHGKDWHRTREMAIVRAEQLRLNRLTSLQLAINKMRVMKFS